MKTLEINAYGVQEMNKQEMVETEGGILPLVIAAIVVVGAGASGCSFKKEETHINVYVNSNPENCGNSPKGHGSGTTAGNKNGTNNK